MSLTNRVAGPDTGAANSVTGAPVVHLDLRNQGLREVPPEVFDHAQTLEYLDLSGNQLDHLPDELAGLTRLKTLFCSNNAFTALPNVLGRCPDLDLVGFKANRIEQVSEAALPTRLRWLILTDNAVPVLPDAIGRCMRLQKLMLAGNRLRALPPSLAQCTKLELLRLAANAFEAEEAALPPWLLALPRLSWLAYAGNPFCEAWERVDPSAPALVDIAWSDLQLGERLGEGASGTIHAARWQAGAGLAQPVAVKIFKGEVTSDGLPRSEKAASIAAGTHASLVHVHGRVAGHPQGRKGLVLALIPPDFRNLAGPPSLDTCSRDVYPPELSLSAQQSSGIAHGVEAALSHIHERGVLHGDLYAHNILFNGAGQALLGDFGAASPLPPAGDPRRDALMALDRRALGILQAELAQQSRQSAAEPKNDAGKPGMA